MKGWTLEGWMVGWLDGWMVVWLEGWRFGRLVGWRVGVLEEKKIVSEVVWNG